MHTLADWFSRHRVSLWRGGLMLAAVLLVAWPRLTDLGGYIIVDEADRWRWAGDFYRALLAGNLRATLVGDGYPGIVPVWLETIWLLAESARQSLLAGHWFGEEGIYMLFHVWSRSTYLLQQRLPIVLFNVIIALILIGGVWRLFGKKVALVGGILIALDPFYLSDSRVNRAEAVITGLMTLSLLCLIFYDRKRQWRYIVLSGVLGGLSFLTKIQALVLLPIIALVGLVIFFNPDKDYKVSSFIKFGLRFGLVWSLAAGLTWFILWPVMWVAPVDTLTLVYNYATRKVDAEGVNLFFWGQTYQNTDPGPFFYLVVFLLRITPLALLGLVGFVSGIAYQVARIRSEVAARDLPMVRGSLMLVIYVLVYAALMTMGNHKQDRYLLPIFLAVDILAALGLVYLGRWFKSLLSTARFAPLLRSPFSFLLSSYFLLLTSSFLLLITQLFTVLPHHPYYYSYFNPIFGGGRSAVKLLRVGWGEGMDQVGAYLAAKPNSRQLVVSSRFTHNMLDFKGELISLGQDGRWPQADYLVLYIQQVQRRLDPSPGFIDYFQAKSPEKVITIGDIDYAWIYPIPFSIPADPQISRIPAQAALLGYSWQVNQVRLVWENLGLTSAGALQARLVGAQAVTPWITCWPDTAFTRQSRAAGEFVESLCQFDPAGLSAGLYTVEIGLLSPAGVQPFVFPQGRYAAKLLPAGRLVDTDKIERFEALAAQNIPADAARLNRVYNGRLRLAAYRFEPAQPRPGQTLNLTLYWQQLQEIETPLKLAVQLADSRSISLGRDDLILYDPSAAKPWPPGEVITTVHQFPLLSDLTSPLAGQLEVVLNNEAEVAWPASTLTGDKLDQVVGRFTIWPTSPPSLDDAVPLAVLWQNGIMLRGYKVSAVQGGLNVRLFWQAQQPIAENYAVFVHLLDKTGQIKAQNDSLPRAGAYPTPWWPSGQVIEDAHQLTFPTAGPAAGVYQLVIGLYRPTDGLRPPLADGRDSLTLALP